VFSVFIRLPKESLFLMWLEVVNCCLSDFNDWVVGKLQLCGIWYFCLLKSMSGII
jgi:hypothetical protein